jgi:hypothetical protein
MNDDYENNAIFPELLGISRLAQPYGSYIAADRMAASLSVKLSVKFPAQGLKNRESSAE